MGESKAIVRRETSPLQKRPTEAEEKAIIITGYVEKYATIAGRAITPEIYKIYVEALSRFDVRRLEKGLKAYLEQGTRFPWPGDLAEYCDDEV